MQIIGKLDISTTDILRKKQLLNEGEVQKFIDSECIRQMEQYTPMKNGVLTKSATLHTKIGSGAIIQQTPYARYLYYGKLMVSPTTNSSWAKFGEKKVLTNKDLKYDTSRHLLAGKMWFERMKADKKEEILKGAKAIVKGK